MWVRRTPGKRARVQRTPEDSMSKGKAVGVETVQEYVVGLNIQTQEFECHAPGCRDISGKSRRMGGGTGFSYIVKVKAVSGAAALDTEWLQEFDSDEGGTYKDAGFKGRVFSCVKK